MTEINTYLRENLANKLDHIPHCDLGYTCEVISWMIGEYFVVRIGYICKCKHEKAFKYKVALTDYHSKPKEKLLSEIQSRIYKEFPPVLPKRVKRLVVI